MSRPSSFCLKRKEPVVRANIQNAEALKPIRESDLLHKELEIVGRTTPGSDDSIPQINGMEPLSRGYERANFL